MASTFTLVRRVEFSDTDMAGIVHFSRYFLYMEATEHAFFRSLGFSIADRDSGIGWPRVEAHCEFRAPLRFEDEVAIELRVVKKSSRSLSYAFVLRKVGGGEVATGRVTAVCAAKDPETGVMRAVPIPEALAAQIEVAAP